MSRGASRAAVGLAVGAALVAGCALVVSGPVGPLVPGARDLPPLTDDLDPASLRAAVAAAGATDADAARRLLAILDASPDATARAQAVAEAFRVMRVREPVLLTAYWEPEIEGRLAPDERFRHALYARPPDLVDVDVGALDAGCGCRATAARLEEGRLRPYATRAEIDGGALAGRGLELAWTDDPVALFALHVQGSGLLRLDDGRRVGVRYAGTNGRPYRSIARVLVDRGLLAADHASFQDVRRVLATIPADEQASLLAVNDRYTFFRLAEGGATGSLGVELTPGRSIAADPRVVPPGTIAYLVTPSVRRLVVAQDTGAAVVGAHADLFLGAGPDAEERAGRMRERGRLWVILPGAEAAPR